MMVELPVLSIRQPHVSHVFRESLNHESGMRFRRKAVENRSWPTQHRGRLLIHVSGSKLSRRDIRDAQQIFQLPESLLTLNSAIIGEVDLVKVVENPERHDGDASKEYARTLGVPHGVAVQFADMRSRYHWIFANARLFKKPIPADGQLRLWSFSLPESVEYDAP